jgi:hypothetical protein
MGRDKLKLLMSSWSWQNGLHPQKTGNIQGPVKTCNHILYCRNYGIHRGIDLIPEWTERFVREREQHAFDLSTDLRN